MKKIASLLIFVLIASASIIDADAAKLRKFYVTVENLDGNETLTACAKGYHMASLWEILDTSNLSYNADLGITGDDTGSGPPSNLIGWIRTGNITAGPSDCNAWNSDDVGDSGTVVSLLLSNAPATYISPWSAEISGCELTQHVWCVQDLKGK
jgi:hypothetical protein